MLDDNPYKDLPPMPRHVCGSRVLWLPGKLFMNEQYFLRIYREMEQVNKIAGDVGKG